VEASIDCRQLYRDLSGDDGPQTLALAEQLLQRRLSQLAGAEDDGQPGVVSAPSGETPPLSAIALVWLRTEPLSLQRVAQAATGDDATCLRLYDEFFRWRTRSGREQILDPDLIEAGGAFWEAAVIRQALASAPGARLPEMLGYVETVAARWQRLSLQPFCAAAVIEAAWDDLRARASACDAADRFAVGRARGIALGESLWRQVLTASDAGPQRAEPPGAHFIASLPEKVRYARGYHANVLLGGRTLDEWFGDDPFDAAAFLSALAESDWVDRTNPSNSRLLRLLDFDGPMFGIFSEAESQSLLAWIQSLSVSPAPARAPHAGRLGPGLSSPSTDPGHGAKMPGATTVEAPSNRRELYHRLLNIEHHPDVLHAARAHAVARLKAARPSFGRVPFHYTADRFSGWLDAQYQRQLRGAGRQRTRPLLSREAYCHAIKQLAPAVLIDGCWLQRIEQLERGSPDVARNLRTIYSDELGAGVVEHNHPRVYRRLLESLGIDLPPVASTEFAHHPEFLEAAFDLPVFMLAISLSPHRFLPELLGLNLAIELSGLGAGYSRVAWELDYWGIDSRIVRLHQSIDNLAAGHAALARDSVLLHLEQVHALGGDLSVQQHWLRVWTGYRSLGVVTGRFRRTLILSYAGLITARGIRRLKFLLS
jgi:hypothetical protein